jgi:glycerol-3-phosphate dehydrogenase
LSLGLDEEMVETCLVRYGASVDALFERVAASPLLAQRIVPDAPFCLAEIVHAVEHEMARTLEDVLRRRIPLALVSRLSFETLGLVAEMVGHALGWTQERRRHEIESLAAVGAPVHVPA